MNQVISTPTPRPDAVHQLQRDAVDYAVRSNRWTAAAVAFARAGDPVAARDARVVAISCRRRLRVCLTDARAASHAALVALLAGDDVMMTP